MFNVLCCSGAERLTHSSTLETASHDCPFSPQVRKRLGAGGVRGPVSRER